MLKTPIYRLGYVSETRVSETKFIEPPCFTDVNNAHWKLDQRTSQRRSHLFWQIFVKDTWMVLLQWFTMAFFLSCFAEFQHWSAAHDVFIIH